MPIQWAVFLVDVRPAVYWAIFYERNSEQHGQFLCHSHYVDNQLCSAKQQLQIVETAQHPKLHIQKRSPRLN